MVILKKIIILTEHESSGASGIVKLENFAGRTSCFVRVLGLNGKAEVCIKCGEDVMYCGTLQEGAMKFGALYDLTKPIYVAVAKQGAIVCTGSSVGRFSASVLSPVLYQYYANSQGGAVTAEKAREAKPSAQEDEIESESANEDAATDNSVETQPLESVEAAGKEHAQSNGEKSPDAAERRKSEKEQETVKEKAKSANVKIEEPFYKQIEASMQEVFDKYERDEELTALVPDSKWARVPVDDSNYYVVGLIYSDSKPNLICYGVPDKDSSNPPDNSNECRQWLELEKGGRGYWMMYQSAISGQTLTTQII